MRSHVLASIFLGCGLVMISSTAAQSQTFAKVRKDTLRVELVETGEIGAVNSTIVSAPMIWSLDLQVIDMVPEGTQVDSGAVLVQFDRSALLTKLATTQTELDGHRADFRRMQTEQQARLHEMQRNVEMAEYALKLAQVQLEQLQYESASRRENGKLEVLKAEIALKEAKTKLEAQAIINDAEQKKQQLKILQSQGQVNEIKRQLNQLTLHAPISGLAVYHADWDGNKPRVGDKVRSGRGLIDLPDLSRIRVKILVNEIDAAHLMPNQLADVTLDAFPTKRFHGRLTSTAKIANKKDESGQVKVFEAILEITESDSLLKPGMTAQVRLQLDVLPDVTVLPIGCVFELDGKPVVFTKKSPKKPTPVQLKARNDFEVSIEGLEVGAEVSWQAGVSEAQPLGYAEFQERLRRPPSEYQNFFTEMEKRHLTFDYEAHRNRPPEPPGGVPGGTEAMLKKFGFPSGDVAVQGGKITMTPEMMKAPPPTPGANMMKMDSTKADKKMPADKMPPREKREAMNNAATTKIDSTKKR